jgi:hypothetical protein
MQASLRSSAHFIQHHERTAGGGSVMNEAVLNKLKRRLGRLHAKPRLGIEMDHEAQIFGQGINFFHIRNSRLKRNSGRCRDQRGSDYRSLASGSALHDES